MIKETEIYNEIDDILVELELDLKKIRRAKEPWELKINEFFKTYNMLNWEARLDTKILNSGLYGNREGVVTWQMAHSFFVSGSRSKRKWLENQFKRGNVNW